MIRNARRMGCSALLGMWLVAFGLLPASAEATTVWHVTNTGDGPFTCPSTGSCTLRGAIAQADGGGGGEVVQVPSGHYTVNVNPIYVTNGMQVVGTAGPAATTVEHSGGTAGILSISSGASNVTVSGLTLTGGQGASGGAIASQASALTLSHDVFTNNTTGSAAANATGGAVNVSGTGPTALTVKNSSFTANRAGDDGGNTYMSGTGQGGAIALIRGGTISVADSVFSLNRAGGSGGGSSGDDSGSGSGGAIWISPATATDSVEAHVARSVFTGNRAGGPGGAGTQSGRGAGGAIAVETDPGPGLLTVAASTFSGNLAGGSGSSGFASGTANGGAVGMFGNEGSVLTMTVSGSTFADNRAGGDGGTDAVSGQGGGGGFYFASDAAKSKASATNSTFSDNHAGGVAGTGAASGEANGGTITAGGPLALTNDTLVGGVAGGANGRGGNLGTLGSGATTLKNTILSHGTADAGPNCNRPITSLGHNLETANDCGLTAAGDRPQTEPLLHALASNGGLTQTIAPAVGSPAIDRVPAAALACVGKDQRGYPRPDNGEAKCDIGAYESQDPPDTKITKATIKRKKRRARFVFKVVGGATGFECALVRRPSKAHHKSPKPSFRSCSSPKTYTKLSSGRYRFLVRAFNTAGRDLTAATKKFKL